MIETTVTLARKGVMQNNGQKISVQISNMDIHEAAYFAGANPHLTFWLYTRGGLPTSLVIQQSDQFTDTQNIDPTTGKNALYRVMGAPNRYMQSFYKIAVERFIGD